MDLLPASVRSVLKPRWRAVACGTALAIAATLSTGASAQMGGKLPRKQKEETFKKTGPIEQQFPFGATWILSDLAGKPIAGDAPSFTLDDKLRATGFGGCNTFSMALYPIRDQKLAAGSIATMKKSCGKDADTLEHDILVGLHSLPTWHLEANGDLTIKGTTGAMVFRRGL